jgi:molybdenum cofactor cytidylyltransferase
VAATAEPLLACLLPAAGGSVRLGQSKQLLKVSGESLVLRAARLLLEQSPLVAVVTGAGAASVRSVLGDLPLRLVHNADWPAGMGGSIAIGMQALGDQPDGVLILHCDQWRINADDLGALSRAWRVASDHVVAAEFGGTFGPPLILPRRLFVALRNLRGESGAKGLVQSDSRVIRVALPHASYDLDRPEDLRQARERDD